jgi:hypothetical protein
MHIDVRRSGGVAGLTRTWQVDTDACEDPTGWDDLVAALPRDTPPTPGPGPGPGARPGVPDDFTWTITVERTTVTIPGTRLDGPWAALVSRVRAEGTAPRRSDADGTPPVTPRQSAEPEQHEAL